MQLSVCSKFGLGVYCFCAFQVAYSQEPVLIDRWLAANSVAVGWCNIADARVQEFSGVLNETGLSVLTTERVNQLEALRAALVELQVKRIYLVGDTTSLFTGEFGFAIPCAEPKAVASLLRSQALLGGYDCIETEIAVLVGTEAVLKNIQTLSGKPSPEMAEATKAIESSYGLAIALKSQEMTLAASAMSIIFPKLNVEQVTNILGATRWTSLSQDAATKRINFEIRMLDSSTAATLANSITNVVKQELSELSVPFEHQVVGNSVQIQIASAEDLKGAIRYVRRLSERTASPADSLKQIVLGLHNYADAHAHFPPQSLVDAQGKRLLSWRVLLLPYIDQSQLYDQFHLNESWDSPHNLKLVDQIPAIYTSGGVARGRSCKLALLTKDSVFGHPGKPLGFKDVNDGLSNTIWLAEAAREHAVPWTKPEDLVVDAASPIVSIVGLQSQGFWASRLDGSAHFISSENSIENINAMITYAGGEVVESLK